jgi:predicted nucleic acid-binding protein
LDRRASPIARKRAATNILVHGADPDAEFYKVCRRRLEECRGQHAPWYLSRPICYESLRICTHPRVFRKPWSIADGWRFIENILDSPNADFLFPTPRHASILAEVLVEVPHLRGNILHDLHTAVLMCEHGIKEIYTLDTDFHRFRFLTVLGPGQ